MADDPAPPIELLTVRANGLRHRVAICGPRDGSLVLLMHGWPESWYSWRHQLRALGGAGYCAIAPDMRGYGGTDAPDPVETYGIQHIAADMLGLLDAFGRDTCALVGHDWGAVCCWLIGLLHPSRFVALAGFSVPYAGRGASPPSAMYDAMTDGGEKFFYISYHNEAGGVAEAEYDAAPRTLLRRLFAEGRQPRAAPEITDRRRAAGGFIGRMGEPESLPAWISEADVDYFAAAFERSGFRGGLNYYRNLDRNWASTASLSGAKLAQPALFVAGAADKTLNLYGGAERAVKAFLRKAPRGEATILADSGHWIQQERAAECSDALLRFLAPLRASIDARAPVRIGGVSKL